MSCSSAKKLCEIKTLLCCAACIAFVCSMHGFLLLVPQVRIPVLILGGPWFFMPFVFLGRINMPFLFLDIF